MNDYFLKILARERHHQLIMAFRRSRQPMDRPVRHPWAGKETVVPASHACRSDQGMAERVPDSDRGERR